MPSRKEEDMGPIAKPMLYDLEAEIDERTNLAEANPEVVRELMALAEKARNDVGDHDRMGKGARFFDKGPTWQPVEIPLGDGRILVLDES